MLVCAQCIANAFWRQGPCLQRSCPGMSCSSPWMMTDGRSIGQPTAEIEHMRKHIHTSLERKAWRLAVEVKTANDLPRAYLATLLSASTLGLHTVPHFEADSFYQRMIDPDWEPRTSRRRAVLAFMAEGDEVVCFDDFPPQRRSVSTRRRRQSVSTRRRAEAVCVALTHTG